MINWTSCLGYGFRLEVKEALNALPEYDERIDDIEATVEREFPLLTLEYGGNMYDNSQAFEQWIFVKNSIAEVKDWGNTVDPQKMLDAVTPEAMEQLFEFVASTGCAVGSPQWRMLLCKS